MNHDCQPFSRSGAGVDTDQGGTLDGARAFLLRETRPLARRAGAPREHRRALGGAPIRRLDADARRAFAQWIVFRCGEDHFRRQSSLRHVSKNRRAAAQGASAKAADAREKDIRRDSCCAGCDGSAAICVVSIPQGFERRCRSSRATPDSAAEVGVTRPHVQPLVSPAVNG